MNDDPKLTEQQLRLITSRASSAQPQLDPEAAMARETFLAVGAALESAAADYDEAGLLVTLSRERTCSRTFRARDSWPLVIGAALAASALIAIVRVVSMTPHGDTSLVEFNQDHAAMTAPSMPDFSRATAGWNDPLDDEIAVAALAIDQIGGRSGGFDGSLYEMNAQLQALSQELLRESL